MVTMSEVFRDTWRPGKQPAAEQAHPSKIAAILQKTDGWQFDLPLKSLKNLCG